MSANKVLNMIERVESIALPDSVVNRYKSIRMQPSTFWSSAGIQLDPIKTNEQMKALFSTIYLGASNLIDRDDQWGKIARRFFSLFFRDLVNFSKPISEHLVDLLSSSSSIQDDKVIIETNIRRWVKSGHRHSRFSESLGGLGKGAGQYAKWGSSPDWHNTVYGDRGS